LLGWIGDVGLSEYDEDICSRDEVDPEYREWPREKVGVMGEGDARSDEDDDD
jgi:hypothetical protein